jgi:hypothetical protein
MLGGYPYFEMAYNQQQLFFMKGSSSVGTTDSGPVCFQSVQSRGDCLPGAPLSRPTEYV